MSEGQASGMHLLGKELLLVVLPRAEEHPVGCLAGFLIHQRCCLSSRMLMVLEGASRWMAARGRQVEPTDCFARLLLTLPMALRLALPAITICHCASGWLWRAVLRSSFSCAVHSVRDLRSFLPGFSCSQRARQHACVTNARMAA